MRTPQVDRALGGSGRATDRRSRIVVGIAALLFGTSGLATQLMAPDLPVATAAGWRVVIGGVALLVAGWLTGRGAWCYPLRWRVIVPGALAFLGFQLGFFLAVDRVGVATATIVAIGTGPVVAGLLDRVRRAVPLHLRWWVGIAVAVAGITLLTGGDGVDIDPVGLAGAFAAGCCFPLFGDAIRNLLADRPALTAVGTVFGASIAPAAVLLGLVGTDPVASPVTASALLYLGLVTTAGAYALWSTGLARLTLGDTVTLTMIEPIAATVLAVLLLHEAAGIGTAVGIVVTLAGVWIGTSRSPSGPVPVRPDLPC